MPRATPQPDPEDLHKDLLATMAASRELGPEMDKALVESYMERHPELKGQPAQALTQPQATNKPDIVGLTGMGVGMIAYITLLIVTKGDKGGCSGRSWAGPAGAGATAAGMASIRRRASSFVMRTSRREWSDA